MGSFARALMAVLTIAIGYFAGAALAYGLTYKHTWHSPSHVFGGYQDPALNARQLALVQDIRDTCVAAGWVGAAVAVILVALTLLSQQRWSARPLSGTA